MLKTNAPLDKLHGFALDSREQEDLPEVKEC